MAKTRRKSYRLGGRIKWIILKRIKKDGKCIKSTFMIFFKGYFSDLKIIGWSYGKGLCCRDAILVYLENGTSMFVRYQETPYNGNSRFTIMVNEGYHIDEIDNLVYYDRLGGE